MQSEGFELAPGEAFLAHGSSDMHVRVCFGNLPPDALRRSMRALGSVLRTQLAGPSLPPDEGGELTPLV
jgi:DNA-binding transcriptional MocR family regulator